MVAFDEFENIQDISNVAFGHAQIYIQVVLKCTKEDNLVVTSKNCTLEFCYSRVLEYSEWYCEKSVMHKGNLMLFLKCTKMWYVTWSKTLGKPGYEIWSAFSYTF